MPRPVILSLHDLTPKPAQKKRGGFDWGLRRRGAKSQKVTSHFGDIATPLEQFIRESEAIVGCVAWITSPRLVDALAGRPVSIIMNKEWALRSTDQKPASVKMRATLARLNGGLLRSWFPSPISDVAGKDDRLDPVRCVGHVSRGGNTPLMHHKFIVRIERGKPVAVWTGSFNFTVGAERNFENSIEIHDKVIAQSYLEEWARVAALSEPLEFAAGKADPDWTDRKPAAVPRKVAAPKPAAATPSRSRTATARKKRAQPASPPATRRKRRAA